MRHTGTCLTRLPRVSAKCATAERLTVRIQQPGDAELLLRDAEGLLQVLLVAPGPGSGQIDHVRPQGVQDGQEDHSAPPAGLEVLHIECAASSENDKAVLLPSDPFDC